MLIKETDEVKELATKTGTPVTFKINCLSDEDNKKWGNRFNSLPSDCGCENGRRYLFLFAPLISLFLLFIYMRTSVSGLQIVLIFFLTAFLAGFLGKINGRKKRNQMVKIMIEEFYEELHGNEKDSPPETG